MAIGAINVVRGSRSSVEELLQIYVHSERLGKKRLLDLGCILTIFLHEADITSTTVHQYNSHSAITWVAGLIRTLHDDNYV